MPRAGLGMMNGIAGFGASEVSTTVDGSGAVTVMPASRNEGLPLMLISRLKENRTSADVRVVPSENLMSLRSLNVNVLASDDAVYELATCGTGVAESEPLKVSSVLYKDLATMPPETSNSRCGSAVFMSNDLSMTKTWLVVVALLVPHAASVMAATSIAPAATSPGFLDDTMRSSPLRFLGGGVAIICPLENE